jgi:hypothetical protein
MGRKLVVLGLVMLLVVSAVFAGSGLYFQKREKQLLDVIKTRLDRLENIDTDKVNVSMLTDIFSPGDLKQILDSYNAKRETSQMLLNISVVFTLASMAILSGWLLVWLCQMSWRLLHRLRKPSSEPKKDRQKIVIIQPGMPENERSPADKKTEKDKSKKKNIEHSRILSEAGWHNFKTNYSDGETSPETEDASPQTLKSFTDVLNTAPQSLDLLFCDEKLSESKKSFKIRSENHSIHQKAVNFRHGDENAARIEKVLNEQKEKIDQQVGEFKQMAETVKQTAERSEPIGNFVKDLTGQVAAIRDYALAQQERIKKLQDGYDWNIIKTFGLKVIRCIDNLDDRIERLKDAAADTADLEELRDELVFALESGGIEQYEPEIESDYSGQEKIAEPVKERQTTDKNHSKGKIAAVVRLGYRHFIDEENFKVIRAARVKLYG